jgi:hypothetical protein
MAKDWICLHRRQECIDGVTGLAAPEMVVMVRHRVVSVRWLVYRLHAKYNGGDLLAFPLSIEYLL